MTDLILIRHASTRLNEEGRLQGAIDPDLSDAGRLEARILERALSGSERGTAGSVGSAGLWTSDLRRARQTASLAFPNRDARPDARLREMDFGRFDGRTYRENRIRHGGRFLDWVGRPDRSTPPEGESLEAFRDRLRAWLMEIAGSPESAVAITHGGAIRMILAILADRPFSRVRAVPVAPTLVLRLRGGIDGWSRPRVVHAPGGRRHETSSVLRSVWHSDGAGGPA